jgi:hypothetical protein
MTKVNVKLSVEDAETLKSLAAEQKEWLECEAEADGDAQHIARLEKIIHRLEDAQKRASHRTNNVA